MIPLDTTQTFTVELEWPGNSEPLRLELRYLSAGEHLRLGQAVNAPTFDWALLLKAAMPILRRIYVGSNIPEAPDWPDTPGPPWLAELLEMLTPLEFCGLVGLIRARSELGELEKKASALQSVSPGSAPATVTAN